MRTRVRYAKTGKVRFVSAIDLGRIWERSLRRADVPIAYSEGFSPHPKISFPDALPLGYASTGEYAELTFAGPIDLPAAMAALNAAFPAGLAIMQAVPVADGDARLSRWLQAAVWDIAYPAPVPSLGAAVAAARSAATLPVARERKGEVVVVDLRPAISSLSTDLQTVRAVLHHVEPQVRPTEVELALRSLAADLPDPALVTRVAQGRPDDDGLLEALSGERIAPLAPRQETLPT